jgi:hypothetical protein
VCVQIGILVKEFEVSMDTLWWPPMMAAPLSLGGILSHAMPHVTPKIPQKHVARNRTKTDEIKNPLSDSYMKAI